MQWPYAPKYCCKAADSPATATDVASRSVCADTRMRKKNRAKKMKLEQNVNRQVVHVHVSTANAVRFIYCIIHLNNYEANARTKRRTQCMDISILQAVA